MSSAPAPSAVRVAAWSGRSYLAAVSRLLLLFIIVPLVDMLLLTRLSDFIGFWNTVGLVIVTGMLGAWLSKREGRKAWRRWQQALAQGQLPEDGVVGSVLLLVGSVLLITPGVLTDAIGLTLLIGPSRRFIARLIRPWLVSRFMRTPDDSRGSSVAGFRFVEVGGAPFDNPYSRRPSNDSSDDAVAEPVVIRRASQEPIRRVPNRVIDVDFEVADE